MYVLRDEIELKCASRACESVIKGMAVLAEGGETSTFGIDQITIGRHFERRKQRIYRYRDRDTWLLDGPVSGLASVANGARSSAIF